MGTRTRKVREKAPWKSRRRLVVITMIQCYDYGHCERTMLDIRPDKWYIYTYMIGALRRHWDMIEPYASLYIITLPIIPP